MVLRAATLAHRWAVELRAAVDRPVAPEWPAMPRPRWVVERTELVVLRTRQAVLRVAVAQTARAARTPVARLRQPVVMRQAQRALTRQAMEARDLLARLAIRAVR